MLLQADDAGNRLLSTAQDGKSPLQKQAGVEIGKLKIKDEE
ncbi:hypothetical protein [Photorhabdus viridis]